MPTPLTAENFVLVGSRDPLDLAKLDKALAYLSESYTASVVLQDMADRSIEININHNGELTQSGNRINWDPNVAMNVIDSDGNALGKH